MMLAEADPRLVVPLVVWFVLYLALVRWTMRRAGPASKASSDARSRGHGPGGGCLYQHPFGQAVRPSRPRDGLCQARRSNTRARPFQHEMRIITRMDVTLTVLNGG
jgi:ATP-binding cassette, subfamily B, multidrug efflux pump